MTKKAETIKLLLLHESQDEAEQLMNLIRNSGRATRGQLIETKEDLEEALKNGTWDLFLMRPEVNELVAFDCLQSIKLLAKDIPSILLLDDLSGDNFVQGLRDGFDDVVQREDQERLLLIIQRELRNLYERRARRAAEWALKETEKRCTSLLDSSRDAITYIIDGMHTYANEAYVELFGYDDAEDLEGMPIMDMVVSKQHDEFKQFLRAYSTGDTSSSEFVCEGVCHNGEVIQVRMAFSNAVFDGEPCTQIMIRSNQADADLQERIKEISSQDLLTGLNNRAHFTQQLEEYIRWSVSNSKTVVLLYIQLDNFAAIQSDVGISGADMVLSDVATKLRDTVPEGVVLARFGDEIFTALVKERTIEEGKELAETLCRAIEGHLCEVQDRTVQVTASVGVTIVSDTHDDPEEIINSAHQASEQVRAENPLGNGVAVCVPTNVVVPQADGSEMVQSAIDEGRFKLLFQPVIDLRGGSGELYEAFLRIVDDEGNQVEVSPAVFLGRITQAELSEKVDRWVIIQAIKLLSEHRASGNNTRLIINVTGDSVKDQTLLPWLSVALKAARMPSDAIVFQFSESDAITYLKQAKDFSRGLKELHCKVSLSHFGCALNPFNTLKHLEVDYLKVDGSFMQDIDNEQNREALKELVAAAHAQGKLTIAPLVESAAILSVLWQVGVNFIQGYYLQAPADRMNYDFSSDE